ncbi:hypothetical protein J23TS8_07850 [Bacillus paralicheniformis]|nr:hypothetical protein J23TS8_07850 [Bacillus paralicheniformis]
MAYIAKRMIIPIVFLFILASCSAGGADSAKGDEKKLTFLFNIPSQTLDPNLDVNYTAVRAGISETLVKISADLSIEPWLAKDWESKDGQTWVFTLKDNLTFQNGKKADAKAVKASLERTIRESKAMNNALKIKEIKAAGQTLTITTKEPFPEFPSELVHPNTSIIDVSAANISQQPVGTGPFQVSSFEAGHKIELERYDDYWDGKPKLKHVTFLKTQTPASWLSNQKMPTLFTDRAWRILTKFKKIHRLPLIRCRACAFTRFSTIQRRIISLTVTCAAPSTHYWTAKKSLKAF